MRRMALVLTVGALLGLVACGGGGGGGEAGSGRDAGAGPSLPAAKLTLVAYSTPQDAYEEITEAFRKTPAGRNVTFTKSYGASGEQSRAVEAGLQADIVAFSLEPDMTRLVKKGLVAEDWAANPTKGMVTDSVVAIVTRKGNPKNIRTWADLTRPGLEIINPNPFTSGGARWNVMAAYGQALKSSGGNAQAAEEYLKALFKNIAVQDDSARKSLQTFTSGKGDVLLAYENEAIFAQQKGQPIDYVVPDATLLIENPVAVTKSTKYPEQAQAFLKYLTSPAAQTIFAKNGYRPVNASGVKSPHPFPTPNAQFTIGELGGWTDVTKRFFDPAGSIVADIQKSNGISVG